MIEPLEITARVRIPATDLSWTAVRSSGPGGQNVNKVASKVDLRFDLEGCQALAPIVKDRLRALAHGRLDQQGRVQIVCQDTRDQLRNLELARERLGALIRSALIAPKPRRPTKPTRGSQRRRIDAKQRQSRKKQLRGHVGRDD